MGSLKTLTKGKVTRVEEGKLLLGDFGLEMGINDSTPVLVIGTRSHFLRVIGLDRELVVLIRVSFSLEGFTESAKEVFSEIKKRSMDMVHSTGFCPLEDSCIWEGYFSVETNHKIEEFANWIRSHASVLDVESDYLTLDWDES